MNRLLPVVFLMATASAFGLSWIVVDVDPEFASWYVFGLFGFLLFIFVFCTLGFLLYFIRTRRYRRYSANWYFKTSFKMSFFVALFVGLIAELTILRLLNLFNLGGVIIAVSLFAFWSYLGKKN